jgi:hypothetical protein
MTGPTARRSARWRTWTLTAAGLCALPAAASAQPAPAPQSPEVRAQAAFDEAIVAWRRGDCIAAVEGFTRAMEAAEHPDTRYNLARALECANEVPRAIAEYERFLQESGDAADRQEVTERLATLRARPVEVFVTTEPLDATVRLDGIEGPPERTPCRLRLTPGTHLLSIDHAGYRPEVHRVVVEPGVAQDVHVPMVSLPASPPPPPPPPEVDRVATRRTGRMISGRAALLGGFSVPRDRPELAFGFEAGVFVRRSLTLLGHAIWIDADGAPFLLGADLGWTFALSDLDLGLFVTGSALFRCDLSCREATFRRDEQQFVGGFAVRADVLLHPRLAVGLFGRAAWRNFDLSNSEALLATGGIALSLHL